MSEDQLQHQYRYKGKFPIIISCRFKDRMVDGQKEGEWIDKTFLGMIYFRRLRDIVIRSFSFTDSSTYLQIQM